MKKIRVLMIAEGDEWSGIESHLAELIQQFENHVNVECDVLLFYDKHFATWLRSRNIRVKIVDKAGMISTYGKIRKVLENERYDILHTHSNAAVYVALYSLMRSGKVMWINTQHGKTEQNGSGIRWKRWKNIIASTIINIAFRLSKMSKVISVSKDLEGWIIKNKHISRDKIVVIRNGISIDNLEKIKLKTSGKRRAGNERCFTLCTVGRLVPVKGHAYLIQALKTINDSLDGEKECRLKIVGDGPLMDELVALSVQEGISEKVDFVGYRVDARSIIAASDAIVIPSIHEGIPYVLLESMMLMCPVVATNVGGLKEVLRNEVDALLVEPRDSSELTRAILLLVKNPDYAYQLTVMASAHANDMYTAARMARDTINLYGSLVTGGGVKFGK